MKKPNKKINIPWIPIIGIFLISPLAYMPSLLDSALFIRYTSLSFFLTISLFIYRKELVSFKFSNVFIVYFMFYIWSLLSALWAYNATEAIFESYKIFLGLGVFFIVVFILGNKTYEKILLITIIICISVYVAIGIIQLIQISLFSSETIYTIISLNANKNLFSAILFLSLPFELYALKRISGNYRYFSFICIFFTMLFILLLQTRAVWIAIIFSIFIFIVLSVFFNKSFFRKTIVWLPITTILSVLIIILLIYTFNGNINEFLERLDIFNYSKTLSGSERLIVWKKSWQIIYDNYIFGVGTGNWQIIFPSVGLDGLDKLQQLNYVYNRPHNDYIWVLAENGLVGFLLMLFIPLFIVYKAFRNLKHIIIDTDKQIQLIFISALSGYFIIAFFDFPKERIEHIIFYNLILGFLYFKSHIPSPQKKLEIQNYFKKILPFALVLYFFAFIIGIYKISGDYYMKKTYDSFSNNDWKSMEKNAIKTVNTFYRLDPTVIPIKWYQALALSMQGRHKESLPLYEEALKENPYQYKVLNNLASNYEILGNHTKAIALYKKALAIAPLFEESSLNLASVYYNQNNIDSALFFTLQVSIDSVRKNHLLKLINQKTIK